MPRTKTTAPPEVSDYPSWWDWEEDGKLVEGAFVRAGTGYTVNGTRPFVVLDVEGTERTIWLHHEVLRNQFAREVQRRPDRTIPAGEWVRIRQLEPRESQTNAGRSYTNYRTDFPEGPEATQADIFGTPPEASAPEQPEVPVDDDVPF
jgi:hypothetical protein